MACHCINSANAHNGDGTSWNAAASNGAAGAFNAIPGTLTRGDTYYFADGSYGTYSFSQSTSGTSLITFKKAISGDSCTSTGFNVATMGSSQAVFTCSSIACFGVTSSYFTLDGNRASTGVGCGSPTGAGTLDCGFKINMASGCSGGGNDCWGIYNNGATATNITVKAVELVGNGDAGNPTFVDRQFRLTGGASTWTIQNNYIHDSAA